MRTSCAPGEHCWDQFPDHRQSKVCCFCGLSPDETNPRKTLTEKEQLKIAMNALARIRDEVNFVMRGMEKHD